MCIHLDQIRPHGLVFNKLSNGSGIEALMTSEHSSEQPPAKLGRRSVADRVWSYRRRCVQVQVGRAELDGLIAEGYVLRGDGDNIARIVSDQ
jgi:hypothetical protein